MEDPDFLIGILTQLKEEKSKRKEIEEQNRRQEERNKYLTSENARVKRNRPNALFQPISATFAVKVGSW